MNKTIKFCPLLSKGTDLKPCDPNCAWYCDDGIPSICMIKDISFTLSRIEKKLNDVENSITDYED